MGKQANVILSGRRGLGRTTVATHYAQTLAELRLTALAVRQLARRGHKVPDDVADALRDLLAVGHHTAWDAHQLAHRLATTAASPTLAAADLHASTGTFRSPAPRAAGLTSVG
ncbi:hypothetical protein OG474_03795 [Kribbella sp. NBC_01505]|uniref:hypothetical protein n=1 Tax=Kribbella sp. NBC_01505 TaxID=2903580 RepID=UPI00386B40CD